MFFLGIGGIGMSALARHFHGRGVYVCGYDKTHSDLTQALQNEGIDVFYDDDPSLIGYPPDLVVYTPAVPANNKLFQYFLNTATPIVKRAKVLGMLSQKMPTIAVAGTHGKTTICAMLTHIMKYAGKPCLSFLGGISLNYNSNYIGDAQAEWLIAEADEFDRSFLHLKPQLALISAVDSDHMDIYGDRQKMLESFELFTHNIDPNGQLLYRKGVEQELSIHRRAIDYHINPPAGYFLKDIHIIDGLYRATIDGELQLTGIALQHPGRHNMENALGAAALAQLAGIHPNDIRDGLNSFTGVRRRFEIHLQTKNTVYVDDYAHHPEEITACIRSAREMWPDKKITGVFQPHLFSRTKDLSVQFAESLEQLDELILLDIYPAREKPIQGIDSKIIINKIKKTAAQLMSKEELVDYLANQPTEVVLTMGAGDIDRLCPLIKQSLMQKEL